METAKEQRKSQKLYFKVDGKGFQNGFDIFVTVNALKDFQYILDKGYLALTDGKILRKSDRANYRLIAQSMEQGSFTSVINILFDIGVPLLAGVGPEKLWEYTKLSFELLKFMYSSFHENNNGNEKPTISIKGDGNNVVIFNGDVHMTVEQPVFDLAKETRSSYTTVAKSIRQGEIDYYQIGTTIKKPEIRIDKTNAELFSLSTKVLPKPIKVTGAIFDFNSKSGNGKISVFPDQIIPSGDYSIFVRRKDRDQVAYNFQKKVIMECRQEISFDPFAPETTKIIRLRLASLSKL